MQTIYFVPGKLALCWWQHTGGRACTGLSFCTASKSERAGPVTANMFWRDSDWRRTGISGESGAIITDLHNRVTTTEVQTAGTRGTRGTSEADADVVTCCDADDVVTM